MILQTFLKDCVAHWSCLESLILPISHPIILYNPSILQKESFTTYCSEALLKCFEEVCGSLLFVEQRFNYNFHIPFQNNVKVNKQWQNVNFLLKLRYTYNGLVGLLNNNGIIGLVCKIITDYKGTLWFLLKHSSIKSTV